jgi:hypothetical protein
MIENHVRLFWIEIYNDVEKTYHFSVMINSSWIILQSNNEIGLIYDDNTKTLLLSADGPFPEDRSFSKSYRILLKELGFNKSIPNDIRQCVCELNQSNVVSNEQIKEIVEFINQISILQRHLP